MSELDAISSAIGALREGVETLKNSMRYLAQQMEKTRAANDKRHEQNQKALAQNEAAMEHLSEKLQQHADDVNAMRPTIVELQILRTKLITWGSVGMAVVVFVGWAIQVAFTFVTEKLVK
jgi:uncharacterized coiled-coil protein SlyX